MRLALIVATHPERRTVDLVYQDTGLRVAEAAVMTSLVASDAGTWDIPSVPKPVTEKSAGALPQTGRQLIAVVDCIDNRPIVVGTFHPLDGQMAFTQQDRHVVRHSSGAYSTVAPEGSIEVWHPSGTYLRIGTGAHEPLAPISVGNAWKEIATAPAPTITLHHPKLDLTIAPDGTVTLGTQTSVNVSAPNGVHIVADTTIQGNVSIQGGLTATQDVVAGSVSLRHHSHSNSGGTGVGGPPVGG